MFQVVDDILDVTRSTTAGKDGAADKATYIKLLGEGKEDGGAAQRKSEGAASRLWFSDGRSIDNSAQLYCL